MCLCVACEYPCVNVCAQGWVVTTVTTCDLHTSQNTFWPYMSQHEWKWSSHQQMWAPCLEAITHASKCHHLIFIKSCFPLYLLYLAMSLFCYILILYYLCLDFLIPRPLIPKAIFISKLLIHSCSHTVWLACFTTGHCFAFHVLYIRCRYRYFTCTPQFVYQIKYSCLHSSYLRNLMAQLMQEMQDHV